MNLCKVTIPMNFCLFCAAWRLFTLNVWYFGSVALLFIFVSLFTLSIQFKKDGEWWTWIDYPRFHELVQRYNDSNGALTFTSADYMAKTPTWAVYGAKEQGFDPQEKRYYRKKQKDISGCWWHISGTIVKEHWFWFSRFNLAAVKANIILALWQADLIKSQNRFKKLYILTQNVKLNTFSF